MKKTRVLFLISFVFLTVASAFAQSATAEKIDDFGELQCEDLRGRLDNFLVQLRNQPMAKGVVIVYEGKYSRPIYVRQTSQPNYKDYLPTVGEARYRMRVMTDHFKFRKFPADRISMIDGGFRENFTVEFWIVPAGAELPKATPTLDKIKYRKGKPAKIVCES